MLNKTQLLQALRQKIETHDNNIKKTKTGVMKEYQKGCSVALQTLAQEIENGMYNKKQDKSEGLK